MMTARKRVGPLPTHRLAVRHSVDYSSLDHFSSNDSLRDSSLSSSSETSSDSSVDASSDSASSHSLPVSPSGIRSSHKLCSLVPSIPCLSAAVTETPSYSSSFVSPYLRLSRSPVASVLLLLHVPGALSLACADPLPPPKRIRSSNDVTDSEVVIEACFDFADIIRGSGVDVRVEAVTVTRDDVETSARGMVIVSKDGDTPPVVPEVITEPAQEGAVEGTYDTLGDLVQRIMPNTRSGASRKHKGVNEQIDRRMARALRARDAARNLEPLIGDKGEQEEVVRNRGNGNGGNRNRGNGNRGANGNGNGNGGGNGYNFGGFMPA
ncbi:hypothetical protein Tco_0749160 [Tanacetum coccineum]|uniref:Uncharacterized protein n=1 Tax=Tanacetum coccineum TaxID=301880 RepID=A0ABQ4YXT0_9ASTR